MKLGVNLHFGVGGEKKIESSSNLTKNYLGEIEERPWGNYHIIARNLGYQIKEIKVYVNSKLSLQKHNHRTEHWVIVSGEAQVEVGEEKKKLLKNQSIYIPLGCKHRLSNPGKENLILI